MASVASASFFGYRRRGRVSRLRRLGLLGDGLGLRFGLGTSSARTTTGNLMSWISRKAAASVRYSPDETNSTPNSKWRG